METDEVQEQSHASLSVDVAAHVDMLSVRNGHVNNSFFVLQDFQDLRVRDGQWESTIGIRLGTSIPHSYLILMHLLENLQRILGVKPLLSPELSMRSDDNSVPQFVSSREKEIFIFAALRSWGAYLKCAIMSAMKLSVT